MSEFTNYLNEIFCDFGSIQIRKMFGGYGVYHQGIMFALVDEETLYLKADATCTAAFQALGLPQFEYTRQNKRIKMSYYMAPADALEDPQEMSRWATMSYQAACRGKK